MRVVKFKNLVDKERETYERKRSIKSPIPSLEDSNRRVSFGKVNECFNSPSEIDTLAYEERAAELTEQILQRSASFKSFGRVISDNNAHTDIGHLIYEETAAKVTEQVLQQSINSERFEQGRKSSRPSSAESRLRSAKSGALESENSGISLTQDAETNNDKRTESSSVELSKEHNKTLKTKTNSNEDTDNIGSTDDSINHKRTGNISNVDENKSSEEAKTLELESFNSEETTDSNTAEASSRTNDEITAKVTNMKQNKSVGSKNQGSRKCVCTKNILDSD